MKTTLVIPCLNEIDGMKVIMQRIHKEWCDQILIVDGGLRLQELSNGFILSRSYQPQ
jgi:hypothetical protein